MRSPEHLHKIELNKDSLLAAAENWTGLSDWGDVSLFEPALEELLQSLEFEARLNRGGKQYFRSIIVSRLAQRLLLHREEYNNLPVAIADKPSFIITGLPRTGTTLLHRLLALDTETDALRYCDVTSPAPVTVSGTLQDDIKIMRIQENVAGFHKRIPGMRKAHKIEPRTPDEEVFLMDLQFMSLLPLLGAHVPSYWNWVMSSGDLGCLYQELKQLIAYVGQYRTGSRWVLKAPQHLWMFNHLLDAFPNAQAIWLHRDPGVSVASCCSLSRVLRNANSDAMDNRMIGSDWLNVLTDGVYRAMADRKLHPIHRVHDVYYQDLVQDPVNVVTKIYEAFNVELPENMPEIILQYLAENPKGKHGVHNYSADTFGLSNSGIRERFSAYIEAVNVGIETAW